MNNPEWLQDFPRYRVWAVVGVSQNREKYGNIIYRDLRDAGYTVYAVNPRLTEVEGDPCYARLADLPQQPDVVNLVIPPYATEALIDECMSLGLRRVWFQPGSESDSAIARAEAAGLEVIANACIMLQKQLLNAS